MVYFLRHDCPQQYIGIGYARSGDFENRLRRTQDATPYPVHVIRVEPKGGPGRLRELAEVLAESHENGIWYMPDAEVEQVAAGIDPEAEALKEAIQNAERSWRRLPR